MFKREPYVIGMSVRPSVRVGVHYDQTVRNRPAVTVEHLWEVTYGESDTTLTLKVEVTQDHVHAKSSVAIRRCEIDLWLLWDTNGNPYTEVQIP